MILREAVVRKMYSGVEPDAVTVNPSVPIEPALDGRLVKASGRLLEAFAHDRDVRLSLETHGMTFECILESVPENFSLESWQPGAELMVTGVYMVQLDENHQAHRFQLRLRNARDVEILQAASWWSVKHALLKS